MPKDIFYFKHDSNAQSDLKIKAMRKKYGWEGYGWYWAIIELMRSEEDYKLPFNDLTFIGLADDFNCETEKVRDFINDCILPPIQLFMKNGTHFYSNRLLRDMENFENSRSQKSIAGQLSAYKRLNKQPFNSRSTAVQQPFNLCSTRR